ncbi:signal transduction histidine kinase [Rivularia sp. PCC 7116]|uniref:hybrid histidine kinase/response regulator HrmK n=1 Tax=Rivularia sp. PCC 7116 TaxID=373994 RepID=UPI00029F34CB|nr:hybrid histidine kinase/response regulator HrmK [Rivularia sp. PCC 7116]AFY58768.1 signal transduction histidine kinase [Rivularia sp. PCC 7116]
MQQYSSLPEQNSQLDNSSIVLTTVEQLRAELWLERSLNQLQTKLNDCLTSALFHTRATSVSSATHKEQPPQRIKNKQNSQIAITQAEIFQTVVNELYGLFSSSVVAFVAPTAIAIAIAQPEDAVCTISYICPNSKANSQLSPFNLKVGKDKTLQLKLNSEIDFEDLLQLEKQQPQTAFCFSNESLGIIGWFIASSKSPVNSSSGLFVIEQISKLMVEAASMCKATLTKLKHVESLQQQAHHFNNRNQELQRTNQLKNQFLANTSHEIRTPLSSIIGFTHLLLAQGYDPSRQRHHEYLNIIQSSGKHLLALINDILDLSKIEANQLEVNWETIDVSQLCRNVLALVKEKAANKGLQMQLDIDSGVTNMVADPLRLKQILLNLLFNAVKFTKTGTVGLEVKTADNLMYFTVWDTGIGISKENQSELFQPYFQIFNERQINGEEGTGLGLTVTRKLAEIHGGWVEVESEIDKGSRFTIVIPIEQNTDADEETDTHTTIKHKAQTNKNCSLPTSLKSCSHILLVEDDIPNAELIKTYLERLGYQLTWVKNASQMWNALSKQDYSVILIDIVLPDANGITLVKQIRENRQYSNICIIAQTAMAMKGDRDTCLDAGVNDYICKPIDLPLLAKILSEYITL